ncbi:MAG TPA: glutamate ABC transporter substrate-binding protein [Actinomycetota bacterium]|nr:glutamate ABC transporter substrate-binding protein [Actinomycetota bacterium]
MKRWTAGLSVLAVLALLAGCSGTTPTAALAPRAPVAQVTPSPSAASCGNVVASLRPPAALPAPGQMPAGSYMRTIQDHGRLVAGVSADTKLFGFLNPFDGQIEGFDIDVLHQIAQAIFGDPNKIEYRAMTGIERINKIRDGSVDLVGRTFTITCDRRQQIDFSSVYFDAGDKVLVRKDSTARGIQDLGGKKVCTTAGSTAIPHLDAVPSKPVPYILADFTDCLVAFQNGEVDAIATDDAILAGLAAQDPYAKIIGDRFSDEPYGIGIALDHPEFTRFVNGVLDQMRANGTWAKLYAQWLVPSLSSTAPPPPAPAYRD